MSYKYEYVENNWDAFLNDMANGERFRYGKSKFFFKEYDLDKVDLIVARIKRTNELTNIIGCEYGRTFFNITYKIMEKMSYDKDSYVIRLIAKLIVRERIITRHRFPMDDFEHDLISEDAYKNIKLEDLV